MSQSVTTIISGASGDAKNGRVQRSILPIFFGKSSFLLGDRRGAFPTHTHPIPPWLTIEANIFYWNQRLILADLQKSFANQGNSTTDVMVWQKVENFHQNFEGQSLQFRQCQGCFFDHCLHSFVWSRLRFNHFVSHCFLLFAWSSLHFFQGFLNCAAPIFSNISKKKFSQPFWKFSEIFGIFQDILFFHVFIL